MNVKFRFAATKIKKKHSKYNFVSGNPNNASTTPNKTSRYSGVKHLPTSQYFGQKIANNTSRSL